GTLTEGRPRMTDFRVLPGIEEDEAELLRLAGSLEQGSEHPLAQAIVIAARERQLELSSPEHFDSVSGSGVNGTVNGNALALGTLNYMEAGRIDISDTARETHTALASEGKTPIALAVNGKLAALLAVADPIKASTPAAISTLTEQGLTVIMLTGDNTKTAQAVANQVGIDEFKAEVKPADKIEAVKALKAQGKHVAMAGDGINDAPALAEADVGIAMGTGTDVAMESAGLTLVRGDLSSIAQSLKLSRAVMRNIRENLIFAFIYNGLGVPIAAGVLYPFTGLLLNPMIAAGAMSLSSVSVITNALRLKAVKLHEQA
ncbi:MAG: HAD-IC family P-type ATPase, partial [Verrucomicrobiota bacterium]